MPPSKAKKAPIKPVEPTPPPALIPVIQPTNSNPDNLPVIYEKIEITEYSTTSAKGPLTIADMKGLLGWTTEKEYQQQMVAEKGGKPEHYVFGELGVKLDNGIIIPVHCRNTIGEKIICKFNAHNRPFDETWCESLVHTILYGQWAGPHTIPGETINGETIRISRYGRVISAQHQMSACILANELLHKDREAGNDPPDNPKYPAWRKHGETFLETIVVTGVSEDPRVIMSVDYVKPRTAADVFYTSEVFKTCAPPERKELCRILASSVETLWNRTETQGYKTHPELVAFLERHKRLLKCVEFIFKENTPKPSGGRKISNLRLQPGTCAALFFIQASSGPKTDGDVYRNEDPPTEKNLDWSYWDKTEEFWVLLSGGKDFLPVRTALGRLVDSSVGNEDNQGMGGRGPEKLTILAAAWEVWRDSTGGITFTDEDLAQGGVLCLSYSDLDDEGKKLPDGQIKLLNIPDFYGIDSPHTVKSKKGIKTTPPEPPPPTKEEMDRIYAEKEERRRLQNMTEHQKNKEMEKK